jgi:hypothetical protein
MTPLKLYEISLYVKKQFKAFPDFFRNYAPWQIWEILASHPFDKSFVYQYQLYLFQTNPNKAKELFRAMEGLGWDIKKLREGL